MIATNTYKNFSKTEEKTRINRENRVFVTFKRIFKTPSAKLGGIVFAIILLGSIFAPFIAPYGAYDMDFANMYALPSLRHLCGTDALGRDIFSRLLYGGKYSLSLGVLAALFSNICGIILGSFAGYFGGRTEMLIMRLCDIWQAIPGLLLTILLSAILGAGFFNTILALSISGIPMGARMTRGQIMAERGKEYLEAAQSINCKSGTIMFAHLLPNVISPTIVSITMGIGGTIAMAAGLSYLGLGVQPPIPEWGAMLSDGTTVIRSYPHILFFPGVMIGLCILSINLMGDGLRDALDPKLRN